MTGRCDTFCTETTELVTAAVTLVEGQFHKTDMCGLVRTRMHVHTHTHFL